MSSQNQTKNMPIGVIDRIRRNCSNSIINDITYRIDSIPNRLIEYTAYPMKSAISEIDIDKSIYKRATISRNETLKKKSNTKQNNKTKFITEYEPPLLNMYNLWRKSNRLLKNNEEPKNTFEKVVKDFHIVYRKWRKYQIVVS